MKCSKRRIFAGVFVSGVIVLTSLTSSTADDRPRYSILNKNRPADNGREFSRDHSHLSQAVVNGGSWAPLNHHWPQETCPHERGYVEKSRASSAESSSQERATKSDGSGTRTTRPTRPASYQPLRFVPHRPSFESTPPVWFLDGPLAAGRHGPFRVDLNTQKSRPSARIAWLPDIDASNRPAVSRASQTSEWDASSFKASDFQTYVDPFDDPEAPWHSLGERYLAQNQFAEAKSNIVVRERNMVLELFLIAKSRIEVFRQDRIANIQAWPPVKRFFAGIGDQNGEGIPAQASLSTMLKAVSAAPKPLQDWAAYHYRHTSELLSPTAWRDGVSSIDRRVEMHLCGTRFLHDWCQLKEGWRELHVESQVVSNERLTVASWALDHAADWLEQAGRQLQTASRSLRRTAELRNDRQALRSLPRTSR